MRFNKIYIFTLFCIVSVANGQPFTLSEMNLADEFVSNKREQVICMKAAKKFHYLLNEYRAENELDTLSWSDLLWLTALNHTIWMGQNEKLSHKQELETPYFTGISPSKRMYFSDDIGSGEYFAGENVWYSRGLVALENEEDEIAKSIAVFAFSSWKNSKGHNKNMLREKPNIHAAAFYYNSGKFWGTSLFGRQSNYTSNDITRKLIHSDKRLKAIEVPENTLVKNYREAFLQKYFKLNKGSIIKLLKEEFFKNERAQIKFSKHLENAAQKHAEYILKNGRMITSVQEKGKKGFYGVSPVHRVNKAMHGMGNLKIFAKDVTEQIAVLSTTIDRINTEDLQRFILEILNDELNLDSYHTAGYGVTVEINGVTKTIVVVRLVLPS
ncbi:MAG: CAP domain-containing protein [Cryomorphaceae bacterium]|nr:CAP domain-containing protein [Cryomorphaceae bacterium]